MQIWGHRGAYADAPENTLTGFQMAVDLGADGVELDIQRTKDGAIVVIHDETVDRTSNGTGLVKDFKLVELKQLNFNKRGITPPPVMAIPTLGEVLELLKPTNLMINIELKTGIEYYEGIEEAAVAFVQAHDMMERVVWSSFNHYSVQAVKELAPEAQTALLCGGGILVTAVQCKAAGAAALHPHISQLRRCPGLAENCHKHGIAIRPWTVDTDEDLRFARDNVAESVIVNRIAWAQNILGR